MLLRFMAFAGVASLLGACGPAPTSTAAPSATNQVVVQGLSYQPNSVRVKVGGTITWTNVDSVPHTVTADASLEEFASNLMSPGDSFVQSFTHAGTFTYHCIIHDTMHGTVVVSS